MTAASNKVMIVDTPAEVVDARPGSRLMWPVEAVASILLVVVIGLLLAGVVSRYALSLPIVWIDEAASISFLWLAMLGSAIAIDRNEHLRLTIFLGMVPERVRDFVNVLALLVVATVLLALIVPASEYVQGEWYVTSAALNIPMSFRASAIVVGDDRSFLPP